MFAQFIFSNKENFNGNFCRLRKYLSTHSSQDPKGSWAIEHDPRNPSYHSIVYLEHRMIYTSTHWNLCHGSSPCCNGLKRRRIAVVKKGFCFLKARSHVHWKDIRSTVVAECNVENESCFGVSIRFSFTCKRRVPVRRGSVWIHCWGIRRRLSHCIRRSSL